MNNALTIAKWFINKAIEDSPKSGEFMTPLKVQKLLYYSQGFNKIINKELLFKEKIMAWPYGPVVENVFTALKQFGSQGISTKFKIEEKIDSNIEKVLNLVYEKLGQFSAYRLVELTHNETPWKTTAQSKEIKVGLIEDYFLKHYFINV